MKETIKQYFAILYF